MARRQQLTEEIIERLEEETLLGAWPHVIAKRLGIHKSTYQNWMAAGEKHHLADTAEKPTDGAGYLERQLYERIEEAEAQAEIDMLNALKVHADSGKSTWNGYMAMLERRFPERWRKKDAISGSGQSLEQALADIQRKRSVA